MPDNLNELSVLAGLYSCELKNAGECPSLPVMIDDTPRNSESKSIGIMLRILKKHGVQRVLSYADPNYGHVGTIYRASGFTLLGQTPSINVVWYRDSRFPITDMQYRKWSTRIVNRYVNYQNKDTGPIPFAREIRDALKSGKAVKRKEAGKFIYLKDLDEGDAIPNSEKSVFFPAVVRRHREMAV